MAAIKLLETFSVSRVRGGSVLTTLFHITSSWPVLKKKGVWGARGNGGEVYNHYYIF